MLASAGFGMLTAPIIELHNQKGYFLHHVIFACCTLICIICLLLLPESRGQSLPESIPDGEHYTRQPLLPPRRGEQPLLPTHAELKDYSGICGCHNWWAGCYRLLVGRDHMGCWTSCSTQDHIPTTKNFLV